MIEIIQKKKNGLELTKEELEFVVEKYVSGEIPDYQMSALLMAIVLNGMTDEETINLTKIMKNSGDILELNEIDGIKVDKHSTGGVGDKTTLVLAPLLATVGLKVVKMSGRGLGHTGGTIDKLESIKGFNTSLSIDEVIKQVNEIGVAVVGQTGNLVPADKKIYALRDVTATVDSIPLIASSIMSKKLAVSSDVILLDIKVGNGALMQTIDDARKLANLMIKIGKSENRKTVCVLSNMDEPLGEMIGNATEVIESIDTLKGNGPKDLNELVLTLGGLIVSLAKNISVEDAKKDLENNLKNGQAYLKFKEMVDAQGGDIDNINSSKKSISIKSKEEGFIKSIGTLSLGEILKEMGAGRIKKEDKINHKIGMKIHKKVGDYIKKDEELVTLYTEDNNYNIDKILKCFNISKQKCDKEPLIYEIIV
ncbi:MAG: thymidine phosphorylase [Bacilli bacterium]|nr:thymidine phosphorylase [Bacilli bacterium]